MFNTQRQTDREIDLIVRDRTSIIHYYQTILEYCLIKIKSHDPGRNRQTDIYIEIEIDWMSKKREAHRVKKRDYS